MPPSAHGYRGLRPTPRSCAGAYACSLGANDWVGEAVKLGSQPRALTIQVPIRDRDVEAGLGCLAAAGPFGTLSATN